MLALRHTTKALLPLAAIAAGIALSACSMGGFGMGGATSAPALPTGLSARMDQPGAQLDRVQAIGLINAYRTANGLPAVTPDSALDGSAQALANQYAQTGVAPSKPQALAGMKLSAGYATFAETFSGWRNNAADAAALRTNASKAGVAMAFNPGSTYGIHWVLVFGN
jgi:uncharacterized protein YkwD